MAGKFGVGGLFGFYSRDTIIVAPDGKVAQIRRNVNAVSDAREALAFIKSQKK
jgi:peroxiredoxin Q/BCP